MKRLIITAALALTYLFGGVAMNISLASAAGFTCSDTSQLSAKQQIECGACNTAGTIDANGNVNCDPSTATGSVQSTIRTVVNILSAVAGIAAVIMIIIAGLRYVTSAGNPESAKGAKNTILYAVIGLVIVALAQIIVHFVIHTASGSNTPLSNNGSPANCPINPATKTCATVR